MVETFVPFNLGAIDAVYVEIAVDVGTDLLTIVGTPQFQLEDTAGNIIIDPVDCSNDPPGTLVRIWYLLDSTGLTVGLTYVARFTYQFTDAQDGQTRTDVREV